MRKLYSSVIALLAVMVLTVSAQAQPIGRPDVPTLLKSTDAFTFVVDISGSMMMQASESAPGIFNQPKAVLAKFLVGAINDRMPTLDYAAALYTICGVTNPVKASAWDRSAYAKAVAALPTNLPIYGRYSNIGADVAAIQSGLKGAVVFVTDGVDNIGPDAVAAIAAAKNASGAKFAFISLADTPTGKANIQKMAAAAGNAVCVDGFSLMFDRVAIDAFIKTMFYTEVAPAINKSVYFATAKYELDANAKAILDDCIVTILSTPRGVRTVEIEGFADAQGGIGPMNSTLSENRARAVKDYFISKGVPAEKIYFKGNNVSWQYTNKTAKGRHDNRRADLVIN